MNLASHMEQKGLSQRTLAAHCGFSPALISRLLGHGEWPKTERVRSKLRASVRQFCEQHGIPTDAIEGAAPASSSQPAPLDPHKQQEIRDMLTNAEYLTPDARRHFGLRRDPFRDELESREDVLMTAGFRGVLDAMDDALMHHRMCAVIGESGAGKTVAVKTFLQKYSDANRYTIITPYIIDSEDNVKNGRPLRTRDVQEAICRHLSEGKPIPSSSQAMSHRVERLLSDSKSSGRRNLILLDEAHTLTTPLLRGLKKIRDLGVDFGALTGVLIVGQPELWAKLSIRQNADAREFIQRCEIAPLLPLESDLADYVGMKLAKAGGKPSILADDVIDGLEKTLAASNRDRPGETIRYTYPLAVNNLLARALNRAAAIGVPCITAEMIAAALGE